jgi:hypothetical protein
MAIQISGTTVIDQSRNITNFESISGNGIATQAEAEAGTSDNQIMTPLRVVQAISALSSGGGKDSDITWSGCNVGCAVRGGGNVIRKTGGIIWIVAPSSTQVNSTWPMGYCNGEGGSGPNHGQRLTGRSGWFLPDQGMLQTAYSCRTYWDSYSSARYWSSTECNSTGGVFVHFSNGTVGNVSKGNNTQCARTIRVICY